MVVVIDDDLGIREAVIRLLDAAGLDARSFASAEEFLESDTVSDASVLILDIQLPGLSGLALQQRLVDEGRSRPAIFISGQDVARHRDGASELDAPFFTKPFPGLDLIQAVRARLPAA